MDASKHTVAIAIAAAVGLIVLSNALKTETPVATAVTATDPAQAKYAKTFDKKSLQDLPPNPIETAVVARGEWKIVDENVGCQSRLSEARQKDVWISYYKDRRMRWTCKALDIQEASIGLDCNNTGYQEIDIDIDDRSSLYNLLTDQAVTVEFIMTSRGGCFLPFRGNHGRIVGR